MGKRNGDLGIEKKSLEYAKGRNGMEIPYSKIFWQNLNGISNFQNMPSLFVETICEWQITGHKPPQFAKQLRLSMRKWHGSAKTTCQ